MKNWKPILISPEMEIIETMKVIDNSSLQFAVVVDDNNRLLGTVTDGDIRRGILKGRSLDSPIRVVMNEMRCTKKQDRRLTITKR